MTSVISNFKFLFGRPHGTRLPFPHPPENNDPHCPLRVDFINGWPLSREIVPHRCWIEVGT